MIIDIHNTTKEPARRILVQHRLPASTELQIERLLICKDCDRNKNGACKDCVTCGSTKSIQLKVQFALEYCPRQKWPKTLKPLFQ